MTGIARKTDIDDGACGHTPRAPGTWSPNVYANGLAVHRVNDTWPSHCADSCHASVTVDGSPNVFINNTKAARQGDPLDCGAHIATGSNNVFIN